MQKFQGGGGGCMALSQVSYIQQSWQEVGVASYKGRGDKKEIR